MRQRHGAIAAAIPALAAVGYWLFAMPPERFADRMREAVCAQKQARIAVGDFTDFAWDELVVVDSDGDPRTVEKALGVPFGDAFLRPGPGEQVLVFRKGGRIVRSLDYPRGAGGFSADATGRRIGRGAAVFAVRRTQGGCESARLSLPPTR